MSQQTKVTFAVGQDFDKAGKSIPQRAEKRKGALHIIAKLYGGYSVADIKGGWINAAGELVEEQSMVVVVYTELEAPVHEAIANELAMLFNQESVLLAIENVASLKFVSQEVQAEV